MTISGVSRSVGRPAVSGHRRRSRPVIGMLTQDLLELFAEQWLGAVDAASTHGCDFICFCGRALEAPGFKKQANAIYDLVTEEALDGLVVWTSILGINVGRDRTAELCRRFDPLPIVSVEASLGSAPVVLMEDRRGMFDAVNHLIEVHGRRRVAFVRGPATHEGAQERYQGYLDALAHHGLTARPEWVSAPPGSWSPETAAASVGRMLADGEPPDAIVAANDDFAVGVLSALAASNVRTPAEIAVVGFDDSTNIRTHDLGFDSGMDDETRAVPRAGPARGRDGPRPGTWRDRAERGQRADRAGRPALLRLPSERHLVRLRHFDAAGRPCDTAAAGAGVPAGRAATRLARAAVHRAQEPDARGVPAPARPARADQPAPRGERGELVAGVVPAAPAGQPPGGRRLAARPDAAHRSGRAPLAVPAGVDRQARCDRAGRGPAADRRRGRRRVGRDVGRGAAQGRHSRLLPGRVRARRGGQRGCGR